MSSESITAQLTALLPTDGHITDSLLLEHKEKSAVILHSTFDTTTSEKYAQLAVKTASSSAELASLSREQDSEDGLKLVRLRTESRELFILPNDKYILVAVVGLQ